MTQLRAQGGAGPGWATALAALRFQCDSSPWPRRHEHQAGHLQVSPRRRGALDAARRPGREVRAEPGGGGSCTAGITRRKAAEKLAREELLQLQLAESERRGLRETRAGRISYPASPLSGESHFAMQETEATERGKSDTHLGAERWHEWTAC